MEEREERATSQGLLRWPCRTEISRRTATTTWCCSSRRWAEKEAAATDAEDPDFALGEVAMRELQATRKATHDDLERPHPFAVRLPENLAGISSRYPDDQEIWHAP